MAFWNRFFGSAGSTAMGVAIGATARPALDPAVQEIVNEAWSLHPDRPLSPAELADAVIRDLMTVGDAETEAAKSGIDTGPFKVMRGLAGEPPGLQQLLELWNRKVIEEGDVTTGLKQSRYRPEWIPPLKALRYVLVPVSDLIRMAVREVFSPGQRAALDLDAEYPDALTPRAAELGLRERDARDYWAAHWNLPSYEQGVQMHFRGELSQDELANLLKAQDYAPTWRGKLLTIARAIPGISDMIRFAVREVYDPDKRRALQLDAEYPRAFTAQAAKHGMAEEDARDYWAAHWQLPSATQGYQMLWRGEITQAQLTELLKALDYAPLWRDPLQQIAYHVPGRIDLRRMYAHGVIDRARVKRGYLDLGYTPADAELLTQFTVELASTQGTGTTYTHKAQTQLWTTLHRSFVGGESDEQEARDNFDAIGVPADQQDDVLALWTRERDLRRRTLTPAQVKKAFRATLIDQDTAMARLLSLGYSAADAELFLDE